MFCSRLPVADINACRKQQSFCYYCARFHEKLDVPICRYQSIYYMFKVSYSSLLLKSVYSAIPSNLFLLSLFLQPCFITHQVLPVPDGWDRYYFAKKCLCGLIGFLMNVIS